MHQRIFGWFACLCCLMSAPLAFAQGGVFRSTVELVTLNVTVTDGTDRHVADLKPSDFAVFEDGVPQQISFFAASRLPVDVALLIDTSSSMEGKLPLVQEAASRFLRSLRPIDRVSLTEFNSVVRTLTPLTTDHAAVEAAIRRTKARGGTMLYTALYVALHQLVGSDEKPAVNPLRRAAIVVLTDGVDTGSLLPYDDLLDRVRRTGVGIYPISVISPSDAQAIMQSSGRRFLDKGDFELRQLAEESGGRPFFPLELEELDGVYAAVSDELSTPYALGYTPSRVSPPDGSFRRIQVRIPNHPEVRSRTRSGYYAPRATRALLDPPAPVR